MFYHLKFLYFSLIHSYLNYGPITWGNAYKAYLNKFFILQKKAIRILCGASYNEHTPPLFQKTGILDVFDLYRQQILCFMHSFVNGMLPNSLMDIFQYPSDIHSHNTRHKEDPKLPNLLRTDLAKRSVLSTGPLYWASLDLSLKNYCSKYSFKRKVREIISRSSR